MHKDDALVMDRLAIFSGQPAFTESLHVGRPNIGDRERFLERVNGVFDRVWLTNNGILVQEFEQRVAEMTGAKHCIAVCNGTLGLQLVFQASELSGEVILPSFTFVATAHALQWLGLTPVFCDIDPATHNIDPARVEELITPRTSAILGVHLWGRACAVDELQEIADRRNVKLIFDAAQALGCSYRGEMLGGFGEAEVFSFHATKFVNSLEGGVITTNDDALADRLRITRNFGFDGYDSVAHLGTNAKMNEVCAAMGLTSLESIDEIVDTNQRNYVSYCEGMSSVKGVDVVRFDEFETSNFQYIVVEIDELESGLSRDDLVAVLHAENVLARRFYFPGCHRMQPYSTLFPGAAKNLYQTEALGERVVAMPTGTAMDDEKIRVVCDVVRCAVENSAQVGAILREQGNGQKV